MQIFVSFSPILYPAYETENSIVIIVDIFRATTSICTAFHNGAIAIRTLASIEEAKTQKSAGKLVAAERNTQKCDFADFGNSPFDFTAEKVSGKEINFTTTNGTHAVEMAKNADEMLIGSFSNIDAVSSFCSRMNNDIVILCSGWKDRYNIEDTLFAGALTEKLITTGAFEINCDATRTALQLWQHNKENLFKYIIETEHYERMKRNNVEDSVPYCLLQNTTNVLPRYDKTSGLFRCS